MLRSELVDEFLQSCRLQRNLDAKTVKAYGIDLQQFLDYLDEDAAITRNRLMNYISYLNSQYKPRTVKRKICLG